MSADRVSLDANILFYAIDKDAGDRHGIAREVVRRAAEEFECILALQALCEFFAATTRKGKLTAAEASARIDGWQGLFPVVAATPASLRLAVEAVQRHTLSFWDALLWAVCKEAGVTLFLSEDLQHDRDIEGVLLRNPFQVADPFTR